jgi:hypothetical protein
MQIEIESLTTEYLERKEVDFRFFVLSFKMGLKFSGQNFKRGNLSSKGDIYEKSNDCFTSSTFSGAHSYFQCTGAEEVHENCPKHLWNLH